MNIKDIEYRKSIAPELIGKYKSEDVEKWIQTGESADLVANFPLHD